ncbi:MAG TPA: glycosyltransferase family 2 protein [Candidatus Paceibacterota bacterium]
MEPAQVAVYVVLFVALYFEVFLMITFFEHKPGEKTSARPTDFPSVDIIVPCWNEEKTLANTVQSLLALDYPKDKLGIMIIDDGSKDSTLKVAQQFADNPQVKIFSKENGGKYTALNFGIERSQADFVGCLDADSFVMPDALIESIKKFEGNPDTMAVVPAMKVYSPRNLLELSQAVEYTFGIFYKKMFDNIAAISVLPGPFSIYRRSVFSVVGMFRHAHNTEDMEMAFRLHKHHMRIENAHTAVVYTKVPRTIRALLKQRTRWSQGFLDNSKDYKHMYFNPEFGNFGILVLPFSLLMFFGGLYTWFYLVYQVFHAIAARLDTAVATRIPLHMPSAIHLDWFYVNTSMLTFISLTTITMTIIAIWLGRRIAGANFGLGSLLSYLTVYGFIAPFWLLRAAWGSARSKTPSWR